MPRQTYRPPFIRQWREFRGLSLDKLIERLTDPETGAQLITKTSLSRIERGLQPYRQPILEAIAAQLRCSPGSLLDRDPKGEAEFLAIWESLPPSKQQTAKDVLKALQHESENDHKAA